MQVWPTLNACWLAWPWIPVTTYGRNVAALFHNDGQFRGPEQLGNGFAVRTEICSARPDVETRVSYRARFAATIRTMNRATAIRMTRSKSPTSIPSSSVLVATITQSRPSRNARSASCLSSTLREL